MKNFQEFVNDLQTKIQSAYENSPTAEESESLAGQFLNAQLVVSAELRKSSLNARMRKQGVKAIRAAVYIDKTKSVDKKPTEAALTAMIDSDDLVLGEQNQFDVAEVETAELERLYDIFRESHIFFRTLAKGTLG